MGSSEGIRDIGAAYGDAVTRWDPELLAGCFTEDAVWEAARVRAEGRDSILEALTAIRGRFDRIIHLVHNVSVFDELSASAGARTYATELTTRRGKPGMFVNLYHDRCVLDGGRWLFAHRRLELLYQGPPDLTGTFS
jgi:ketosteroid isomerase-like protein